MGDSSETVFILGAGASIPYGLPSGSDLFWRIINQGKAGYTSVLATDLGKCGISYESLEVFVNKLLDSHQGSVDAFLSHKFNYEKYLNIGKLAMSSVLLRSEHAIHLNEYEIRNRIQASGRGYESQNWFANLWKALTDNRELSDLNSSFPCSFITFNYDRTLEMLFYTSVIATYGLDKNEAADFVRNIPILHVHGDLGPLPFANPPEYNATTPFGDIGDINFNPFQFASGSMKIVHEGGGPSDLYTKASDILSYAKRVYITGFAFHPLLVERLALGVHVQRLKNNCYASVMGLQGQAVNRTVKALANSGMSREYVPPWLEIGKSVAFKTTTIDLLDKFLVI